MGIVKFMPLVPLMAQVAETHFDTCNFCKLAHNATFLYQYECIVARAISDHIHVLIYVPIPLVP